MFADIIPHHVRVCGRNDDFAPRKMILRVADHQFAVQHVDQVAVAGLGGRERVCALVFHIKPRDVAERQDVL